MGILANNKLIYRLLGDKNFLIQKNGKIRRRNKKGKFTQAPVFEGDNGRLKLRYRGKNLFISRIIYAAFGAKKLKTKLIVDHKNGDPTNNAIQNLQQISQSANIQKRRSLTKFTLDQLKYMRMLFKKGASLCGISRIMKRPTRSVVYAVKHSQQGR